jgi:hypothetical protein
MNDNELNLQIKELLSSDRKALVEAGKYSIFVILNAIKKWMVDEEDVERKSILFLIKALGTFIYADGELQEEEYDFFVDIMNSRKSGISKSVLEKMLKKDSKDSLVDVLMLNELIDNLGKHNDEEIAIVKKALCSLGILFCALDGNVTKEEKELINFYLAD